MWSILQDAVLPVNIAATAEGTNCDVAAAAGMMSSVTQKCGINNKQFVLSNAHRHPPFIHPTSPPPHPPPPQKHKTTTNIQKQKQKTRFVVVIWMKMDLTRIHKTSVSGYLQSTGWQLTLRVAWCLIWSFASIKKKTRQTQTLKIYHYQYIIKAHTKNSKHQSSTCIIFVVKLFFIYKNRVTQTVFDTLQLSTPFQVNRE